MSLLKYKDKRNFKNTPEPSGKKNFTSEKHTFVVQRHDASHLHYDFRYAVDDPYTIEDATSPKPPLHMGAKVKMKSSHAKTNRSKVKSAKKTSLKKEEKLTANGHVLTLTNQDKIYWPDLQ